MKEKMDTLETRKAELAPIPAEDPFILPPPALAEVYGANIKA